jgi:hypothetical protein
MRMPLLSIADCRLSIGDLQVCGADNGESNQKTARVNTSFTDETAVGI